MSLRNAFVFLAASGLPALGCARHAPPPGDEPLFAEELVQLHVLATGSSRDAALRRYGSMGLRCRAGRSPLSRR